MRVTTVLTVLLGTLCFYGCDETPAPDSPDSGVVGNDDLGVVDAAARPDMVSREDSTTLVPDATVTDGPPPATTTGKWLLIEGPQPAANGATVTGLGSADGAGHSRVLVAGGYGWQPDERAGNTQLKQVKAEAWIYDMASRTFQSAGKMAVARYGHTATLLSDGRVLVVGGRGLNEGSLASTEVFDPSKPAEEAWSAGPDLLGGPRYAHAAVLLEDGRVFVLGAWNTDFRDTVEVFSVPNPKTQPNGRWVALAEPLRAPRAYPAAVRLESGKLLIAGGGTSNNRVDTVELYDPLQGHFRVLGAADEGQSQTLSTWKASPTLTVYRNQDGRERVLVVGGGTGKDEIIDPAFEVIRWINHAGNSPQGHAASLLHDGRVLVCGGDLPETRHWTCFVASDASVDVAWNRMPDLNVGRSEHAAITLQDGTVLIVGGVVNGGATLVERAELLVLGEEAPEPPPTPVLSWKQLGPIDGKPSIKSVWGAAIDDLWVGTEREGAVYRWNGDEWTRYDLPEGYYEVKAIDGNSATDVYALGDRGRVWHFDGEAWSLVREPDPYARALWVEGKTVYVAIGNQIWVTEGDAVTPGESLLSWKMQYEGSTAGTSQAINDIWSSDGEVFAAGQTGLFLKLVDDIWVPQSFVSNAEINAVSNTGEATYFVGPQGLTVLRIGDKFQTLDSRTHHELFAGSAADGKVFAGGDEATLLYHQGEETYWRKLAVPNDVGRNDVTGVWNKGDDVVIVTANNLVFRGTFPAPN